MPIALSADQSELAEAVSKFVSRVAPCRETRQEFENLAAGKVPAYWSALIDMGLHAIHLPLAAGGQGGKYDDLAVVIEEAGRGLLPGPLLPTVLCSAVVMEAKGGGQKAALAKFITGSTGALVPPGSEIVGKVNDGGQWELTGTTKPIIGLLSAELLVVGALVGNATEWFVIAADLPGLVREPVQATDLTRDAGILKISGLKLGETDRLIGVAPERVAAISGMVFAAEAAGILRWTLDTSVAYTKVRTQFDKLIGSFQAVKHKCARLMVTTELAAAAAWDAAVSLDQDSDQQLRAVATASVMALGPLVDSVSEGVSIHGGIGFTWEHDLHLYLRRAISIAGAAGPSSTMAQKLGVAALTIQRRIEVELPEEDPEFRAWVGSKLDAAMELPGEGPDSTRASGRMSGGLTPSLRRSFLANNGLVSSHWPKPWGLGASPTEQVVISQEFSKRSLNQPTTIIGEWAMPTIFAHGSALQHEKFALPSLRGEIRWCQLFSEPGAGSDLAGLSTKAVKVEGGWQIDGQKVWTSSAREADWGICLARTDKDVPKHKGISYFLVDMRTPGVDVRPLKLSNGESELNEVFFDSVFVPDDMLVGSPGEGWRLATTTLSNERTAIAGSLGSDVELPLIDILKSETYVTSRSDAELVLGKIVATSEAIGALNLRETLRRLNGLNPGAGGSVAKVAAALLARESASATLNLVGAAAISSNSPANIVNVELGTPMQFIGGGTVEIQYNIIAERILQMPRS
jgi:alkylation response protein AidB-like acyl-CoA dehydrogenase